MTKLEALLVFYLFFGAIFFNHMCHWAIKRRHQRPITLPRFLFIILYSLIWPSYLYILWKRSRMRR